MMLSDGDERVYSYYEKDGVGLIASEERKIPKHTGYVEQKGETRRTPSLTEGAKLPATSPRRTGVSKVKQELRACAAMAPSSPTARDQHAFGQLNSLNCPLLTKLKDALAHCSPADNTDDKLQEHPVVLTSEWSVLCICALLQIRAPSLLAMPQHAYIVQVHTSF